MQHSSRLPHIVRGSVAAALATFSALFSHIVGGGAMPALLGLTVPLVLSLLFCILLAGRTLSLLRLSASVIVSQTLFHTLFVLGTPAGASASAGADPHSAHGAHAAHLAAPTLGADSGALALMQGDLTMWLSHAVGALITVTFLYRGERALLAVWAIAELFFASIKRRATTPLRLPVTTRTVRMPVVTAPGWAVISRALGTSISRRGPPVWAEGFALTKR